MSEIVFKGKEFVYNHHLAVPFRPLEIHSDRGVGEPSLNGNLIIYGDNLHALKALLPYYAGKIDCIYIVRGYSPDFGFMARHYITLHRGVIYMDYCITLIDFFLRVQLCAHAS